MGGDAAAAAPIQGLYRQALEREGRGGRRVLGGRLALDALLRGTDAPAGVDVHRLRTYDEIREVFVGLSGAVTTEVLAMLPNSGIAAAAMRASRADDLALLHRGVAGLIIYEPGWAADPEIAGEVRVRTAAGARARVIDRVPHRLTIFDRRVAVVPVEPNLARPGAILVREQGMVASLRALFTGIWRAATEFDEFRVGERTGCAPRDRQVLELMSRGDTDEAAAREMDVSVRTYRRYVAEIMSTLGAQSRFQAGVLAVERGWL